MDPRQPGEARPLALRSGPSMPALGLGTWRIGEDPAAEREELAALLHAIDGGFVHIDTAEMYGGGGSERLIGRALAARERDAIFLTSKVFPWNAGRGRMEAACEGSLRRLGTDRIDLYLLHWPGSIPFEETAETARRLIEAGKIRAFGVSNVDTQGLSALIGQGLAGLIDVNQVMYNPARRGIEYDLLPLMRAHDIRCVAYTPIEPARLYRNAGFADIAEAAGLTLPGLALAWHMTLSNAVPIPKSARPAHIDALLAAAERRLDAAQIAAIDAVFPPPDGPRSLDVI